MTIFFLIIGTLAAFSTGSGNPSGYNASMVFLASCCFSLAVILKIYG
jgi:hypothetical protein